MARPVRIANCSGFYGDRFSAPQEQLDGGAVDYLTGDYLAELTMAILWKSKQKRGDTGYAATFLSQMEQVLGTALDKNVKVVTNAGGLNPAALARKLRELSDRLGLGATIMHIEGDDIRDELPGLQERGHDIAHLDTGEPLGDRAQDVVTANVYLGSWGIVEALRQGADVVVCPRVTDAAVTVGPAAYHHGWGRGDWDRLASATVAGHIIECGCQATGGNYPFFREVPGLRHPGFPIVEIEEDGDFTVTKHQGTGGLVSVGTVTAQLVYEIQGPRYLTPDVTARFDTIELASDGQDRVRVTGIKGEPAPPTAKVCINLNGGYRNSVTFPLSGLDIERKAELVQDALWSRLGGRDRFDAVHTELIGGDHDDPATSAQALARLRITVMDRDPGKVGRSFSAATAELGLASYPGFFLIDPPGAERSYAVYWPALIPAELIEEAVVSADGTRATVPLAYAVADGTQPAAARSPVAPGPVVRAPASASPAGAAPPAAPAAAPATVTPAIPPGPIEQAPLGTVFGARSGDKGGNVNVGVWARSPEGYAWLAAQLTVGRFRDLVPETAGLPVERQELPKLLALNFIVRGILGQGAAANSRIDAQAKSMAEYLRAKTAYLPKALLSQDAVAPVDQD
jgi:hypothetical protein